jgi:hypothetical protein
MWRGRACDVRANRRARADVITDVNNQLLNIIENTSAPLIDSPPEVAREIALVDGPMYDAVHAATGSTLAPIATPAARCLGLRPMRPRYGPPSP